MRPFLKFISVCLLILAGSLAICLVWATVEADPQYAGAPTGLGVLMLLVGVPGVLLYRYVRRSERASAKRRAEVAYLSAQPSVAVAEFAREFNLGEDEAEHQIMGLSVEEKLDLIFLAKERCFVRRGSEHRASAAVDSCPSCGAKLGSILLLPGQEVRCQYCNEPIRIDAV